MFSRITEFFRGIGPSAGDAATDSATAVEYEGFTIRASFRRNGPQWMTAGVITKESADGVKEHRFHSRRYARRQGERRGILDHQGEADHRRTRRSDVQGELNGHGRKFGRK